MRIPQDLARSNRESMTCPQISPDVRLDPLHPSPYGDSISQWLHHKCNCATILNIWMNWTDMKRPLHDWNARNKQDKMSKWHSHNRWPSRQSAIMAPLSRHSKTLVWRRPTGQSDWLIQKFWKEQDQSHLLTAWSITCHNSIRYVQHCNDSNFTLKG